MTPLTSHVQISRHVPSKLDQSRDPFHLLTFSHPIQRHPERNRNNRRRKSRKLVRSDDAEVGAGTADRPEQIRVLTLGAADVRSVRQHNVGTDQPVEGQSVAMRRPSITTVQDVPGQADGRAAAVADRAPAVVEELAGYVSEAGASRDGSDVGICVDRNTVHVGQVHDQVVVFSSESQRRVGVTTATGTDLQGDCHATVNRILDMLYCSSIDKKSWCGR